MNVTMDRLRHCALKCEWVTAEPGHLQGALAHSWVLLGVGKVDYLAFEINQSIGESKA